MSAPNFSVVVSPIAAEVYDGLMKKPKSLPPKLFYDATGSELFERITELPEYYLTRTERSILATHVTDIITAAGSDLKLIELGAGTASKTRLLIGAALQQQSKLDFYPSTSAALLSTKQSLI